MCQVGARWLSEWCHTSQTGAGPGGSSDDALALAVSRVLLASRSADEAAAELFDLLGDASFDAIQQLLEHRYLTDFCCKDSTALGGANQLVMACYSAV